MTGRLEGKVAAITGASSGFGAAAARLFVAEGCKVALGDIQEEQGAAIAAELGDSAVFTVDEFPVQVGKIVAPFVFALCLDPWH